MNILTSYLLKKFLTIFFIILFSLEIFFVGFDLITVIDDLPNSANLQLLYIAYNAFFTLSITLPLSLVFGWVVTVAALIKSNEMVAFISVGANPKDIYSPVIKISTLIILFLIALQATPLAYSYDEKKKILKGNYFTNTKSDLFLKYNEYFVYMKKLYPLQKKAEDIHIFKIKENDIEESILAKKAFFQNDRWYIIDAKIIKKPININWSDSFIQTKFEKFLYTLDGFKPKIINNVYEAKSNFSIIDALEALVLLRQQTVNTDKIRSIVYYQLFVPFFIIPILFLVFKLSTINSRFFNTAKFISVGVFSALTIWGCLFMLYKLSLGGIILPEIGILLTLTIFYISTFFIIKIKANG